MANSHFTKVHAFPVSPGHQRLWIIYILPTDYWFADAESDFLEYLWPLKDDLLFDIQSDRSISVGATKRIKVWCPGFPLPRVGVCIDINNIYAE